MSLDKSQLKFFADYIEKELGIVYKEPNYYQLEKRLNEICQGLEVPNTQELYEQAKKIGGISGHFKQLLLDLATNNETSFFRDGKIFKTIERKILPDLLEKKGANDTIRIWSAASSFGQEVYSICMILSEMEDRGTVFPKIELVATDVSDQALEKAKSGKYSQIEVQRGLPAALMVKYFKKGEDDYWTIDPRIRDRVDFKKVNLLDLFGVPGKFDIVLCRNVLIYQNEERKKKIVENLVKFIQPEGVLVLGAAESLIGMSDGFKQEIDEGAVFYKKDAA